MTNSKFNLKKKACEDEKSLSTMSCLTSYLGNETTNEVSRIVMVLNSSDDEVHSRGFSCTLTFLFFLTVTPTCTASCRHFVIPPLGASCQTLCRWSELWPHVLDTHVGSNCGKKNKSQLKDGLRLLAVLWHQLRMVERFCRNRSICFNCFLARYKQLNLFW